MQNANGQTRMKVTMITETVRRKPQIMELKVEIERDRKTLSARVSRKE